MFTNASFVFAKSNDIKTSGIKIGFGIVFHDLYETFIFNAETPLFYIPINIDSWKLEPVFSYSSHIDKENDGDESSTTVTQFGVGVFRKNNYSRTSIYYGVRMGKYTDEYSRNYEDYPAQDFERSEEGTFIAPTLGGEYYFSTHFSLGGELSFKRLISKRTSNSDSSNYPSELATFNSRTYIVLRYYF